MCSSLGPALAVFFLVLVPKPILPSKVHDFFLLRV